MCYKLHNEWFVRRDAITNLVNYLRLLMASGLNIYLSKGAICNTHPGFTHKICGINVLILDKRFPYDTYNLSDCEFVSTYVSKITRKLVSERAEFRCEYCLIYEAISFLPAISRSTAVTIILEKFLL